MENTEITQPRRIPEGCTLKEYRRSYASPELYKSLKTLCIAGYALAGCSALLCLLTNLLGLVDAVFMLVMLLLIHKKRMKGAVFGILGNVVLGNIVSLMNGGNLVGIGWIVVAAAMLNIFAKIDGEYKELTANSPTL